MKGDTMDKEDEKAREQVRQFAEAAIKSTDANHAARGKLLKAVLIPYVEWLDAEVARGADKAVLLGVTVTGFASAVALTVNTLGGVKPEDIEELAGSMSVGFFTELAGALYQAHGKMIDTNRSIN